MPELFILILVYFTPSFVAGWRGHKNGFPIFLVNFIFGWTLIGWFIALIWACTYNVKAYN